MTNDTPRNEALELADILEGLGGGSYQTMKLDKAAALLRSQAADLAAARAESLHRTQMKAIDDMAFTSVVADLTTLRTQLSEQAAEIEKLKEALEAGPSTLHTLPPSNGECRCSQCTFVRMRNAILKGQMP